jgi:NADH-quinone oxidoreductase subunit N
VIGLLALTSFLPHPPLDFGPVAPELILVGVALFILLLDAFVPRVSHGAIAGIAFAGVAAAAVDAVWNWSWSGPPVVLGNMVATDHYATFFVLVLLAVAGLGVLLSFVYLRRSGEYRAEYYTLLLLATAGMTLLAAAVDLILVFLALELLSLSLYLLTGFSFLRIASSEASMKYFLLGAF